MEHLIEILRALISHAHGQGMSADRATELHGLADKVAGVAKDTEEAAETVAEVTGDGTPAAQ